MVRQRRHREKIHRTNSAHPVRPVQLSINGVKQGLVQDEYSPSVGYSACDLGTQLLYAGNNAFKFTVAGKNAAKHPLLRWYFVYS
jgi:hypothetical protein